MNELFPSNCEHHSYLRKAPTSVIKAVDSYTCTNCGHVDEDRKRIQDEWNMKVDEWSKEIEDLMGSFDKPAAPWWLLPLSLTYLVVAVGFLLYVLIWM